MKPARIRELKVFGILFLTFFFGIMIAFGVVAPLLWWGFGTLHIPNLTSAYFLRIVRYALGFGFVAAAILFLEGKHSGRW